MILKQQLIENLEQLSAMDLIIVNNFVQMLTKRIQCPSSGLETDYLKTREALANCQGNLSDDIIRERDTLFDTSALVKYFHAELIKIADEIAGIRQRTGREKPSVIT